MHHKHVRIGAASLAAAALILTGCSGGGSAEPTETRDPDEPVTINFLHRWPEEQLAPYFQSVADAYMEEHPNVTINIETVGNQNYRERLQLLTGQDELPDIFWATPGNLTSEFVNAGLVHDLTGALEDDGWADSLDDRALDSYKVDDKYYGVPLQSNYKFLTYNPALLEQAGVEVPETLDELYEACDALRGIGVTPVAFGNAEGWPAQHYMTVLTGYFVPADVLAKDFASVKEPGKWSDPGYEEALDAFSEIQARCFEPGAQTSKFDAARAAFLIGQAAMYAGSFGEMRLISDQIDPAAFPDSWGMANMPAPEDGDGNLNAIAGGGNGIVVKEGPNADVATDFLRFMTNEENASRVPSELGWVSSVTAANTPDNTLPQTQAFLTDVVANVDAVNLWLDNALSAKTATAFNSALEGLLGGQLTTEQVLETLRTTQP